MNTTDEVSNEIRNLLEQDETALGQVYIALKKFGENETQIQVSNKAKIPPGTVAAEYQIIKQLLQTGPLPSTTNQCLTIANGIRRFKNRSTLEISDITSSRIDAIVNDLLTKAEDPELVAKEKQKNIQKDEAFNNKAGIYVYTFPHYRTHPAVESTDDTPERYHLKVGKTSIDAKTRIKQQTTGMPENPIPILLIVGEEGKKFSDQTNSIDQLEKLIHEHLEIIGHARNRKKGGGKEWFLSNKETIVSIADLIGLEYEDPEEQPQYIDR